MISGRQVGLWWCACRSRWVVVERIIHWAGSSDAQRQPVGVKLLMLSLPLLRFLPGCLSKSVLRLREKTCWSRNELETPRVPSVKGPDRNSCKRMLKIEASPVGRKNHRMLPKATVPHQRSLASGQHSQGPRWGLHGPGAQRRVWGGQPHRAARASHRKTAPRASPITRNAFGTSVSAGCRASPPPKVECHAGHGDRCVPRTQPFLSVGGG